jgi:hypothetical protein
MTGLLAVGLVVLAATTAASAGTTPVPLRAIGGLPSLPKGKPNATSVVAVGPYDNVLPVMIRNNSKGAVVDAKVTATAYNGGRLIATGSDQGVKPELIPAGALALAYVYFNGRELPAGTTYRFNVSSTPAAKASSFFSAVDIPIKTARYVDGQLVGVARSRGSKKVSGPLGVYATCFTGGKIVAMETGFADSDDALPGVDVPFTLDFSSYGTEEPPACAKILVSMTGYDF